MISGLHSTEKFTELAIKQLSCASFLESSCPLYIAARRHGHDRVQHHTFKPADAVSPYFHHTFGMVGIGGNDDPSFGS